MDNWNNGQLTISKFASRVKNHKKKNNMAEKTMLPKSIETIFHNISRNK